MARFYFPILITFFFCTACKTPMPMTADHSDRIVLGSMGGVVGKFQEHTVTPDGSTFSQVEHQGEIFKGRQIEMKIVDQAFLVLEELQKENYNISDVGDMTYYVKLYRKGEELTEWVWGGRNVKPDERLQIMYKTLSKFCNESGAPLR